MAGRRRNVNIGANSIVYSGRGRPRTKEAVDRPLPVGIILGSPSPGGDMFKNRKIRVGGPFQAKVPKQPSMNLAVDSSTVNIDVTSTSISSAYRSSRAPPFRVSMAHPHLTQDQVNQYEREQRVHQEENDDRSSKQEIEGPDSMDIDNSLLQPPPPPGSTEGSGSMETTPTISPDSSNSVLSNTSGSPNLATDRQLQQQQEQQQADADTTSNDSSCEQATDNGQCNHVDDEDCFESRRGGLLLHSTNADTLTDDSFWNLVQPLVAFNIDDAAANTENNVSPSLADSWKQQIHRWHVDEQRRQQEEKQREEELEQLQLQQQPKRRGRRKRKKEPDPAAAEQEMQENLLEWYDQTFGVEAQRAQKRPKIDEVNEEDKAHALQHVWLRHRGQGSVAKIEAMVQLSSGNAELARRICHHKRRRATPITNTPVSLRWREYCEQSTRIPMIGDFRRPNLAGGNKKVKPAESVNIFDSNDASTHKEVWASILVFAQAIEEKLTKAASGNKKDVQLPKLSTLCSFLNNAHQVRPLPGDIFRCSDVPPAIDSCLDNIAYHVDQARSIQAKLMDLLDEANDIGVDLDALQKLLDQSGRFLAVELDDANILEDEIQLGLDWQKRLDAMVAESDHCLSNLEELAEEGRSFAFRSKSLVCLENRIFKAHQLRDRIVEWKKACANGDEDDLDDKKECVKYLLAMVREANRLKLSFPEVAELLETHQEVEAWIDRANIAIRSRISLTEIKSLIKRGHEMPVDLVDFMEKLRGREGLAEAWIHRFEKVVPRPGEFQADTSNELDMGLLRWMQGMRGALLNGKYPVLHDLASEGSRIPVEVDLVKLLQLELDAKSWATKAKKWIPNLSMAENPQSKRGKLEDLREHIGKAAQIREKLDLSASAKEAWTLDGEVAIRSIVRAADEWFLKYKPFLDWDNRRSLGRSCLSLATLRTIVNEGNAIYANIGSGIGKMTRILAQAEGWVEAHEPLLLTCNIIPPDASKMQPLDKRQVTFEKMTEAAEAAASGVALDLDEAKELLALVETVKEWSNRVANAAPKRSVRGRGRKARFTVDDIIRLIKEASDIPVDTTDDINRLQIQLSAVQEWRAQAREKLEEIANGFHQLRHVVDDMYGAPNEYSRGKNDKEDSSEEDKPDGKSETATSVSEEKKVTEDMSVCETSSTAGSEQDNEGIPNFGKGVCNVNQLIKVYRREAKAFGVVSGEVEAAEQLDKVSNWCIKSLKYLVTQRDVFDKRFFRAFDRFIAEGRELVSHPKENADAKIKLEDQAFSDRLNTSWMDFVSDQLQRLDLLLADREEFVSWCDTAEEQLFTKDKPPTLEKLQDISDRSRAFPAVCDMVQKVRGQFNKALEWRDATAELLKRDEKLCRQDAKNLMEEGEKLGFCCEEMKVLRNALRSARNWTNRVKRCKLESGSTNATAIQALIDEHGSLLLEMPEELSRLQQAMQSYCICRRPYSGFMIGCDECEEWYHGSCIGVSESKADRFDKYVCIRCSLSRAFKNTAKEAVGIVRKWSCSKDMKKARQVEAQKHQRKVRKETKDIEKLRAEIAALETSQVPNESPATVNGITAEKVVTVPESTPTPESAPPGVPHGAPPAAPPGEVLQEKPNLEKLDEAAKQPPSRPKLSPEEVQAKINKAQETIRQCGDRLSRLSEKAEERKAILCIEDAKKPLLKNWCLRVRTLALIPRSLEASEQSRPLNDGSLSASMKALIDEAQQMGISNVSDVEAMINAFGCMSWCLLATRTLARKPTMREMELLVNRARRLKLIEEKTLRTIKAIVLRAKSWQGKVLKSLTPSPGETKPYNVDSLKELETSSDEIPVLLKEEALLSGVIEDAGCRHCVCGGPTDARVMLGCDNCEKWFHGPCVDMTKQQCDSVEKWVCPPCTGAASPVDVTKCGIVWEDRDDPRQTKSRNVAAEAPNPTKMWPPFGLFGSDEAREVLGDDCSALPDVAAAGGQSEFMSQPPVCTKPQSEATSNGEKEAMLAVPPTALVLSADVSQEPDMPLNQGLPPSNCALLADSDKDPQSAASTLKTGFEISQHQAFQWLAQSGAAALAASQVNLAAQVQPQAFGWQHNPFLSAAATAAAAASLANPSNLSVEVPQVSESTKAEEEALSALAQLANNPQLIQMSNTNGNEGAGDTPKAESMEVCSSTTNGLEGANAVDKIRSGDDDADQYPQNAPPSAATAPTPAPVTSEQPELPPSPNQLNTTALNLIVAALPVQESGS